MAHPDFGPFWQQPEFADVEIVIYARCASDTPSGGSGQLADGSQNLLLLKQLPGHKIILSSSRLFAAQALRWQAPDSSSGGVSNTESSAQQPKQQIKITLPDASYEAAAMAVLAALYLVKPVHELLGELTQQQLLQAAELADMWEVAMACSTAIDILAAAANSEQGLDTATVDHLLAMTAVPDCLQPLLEHALISRFGHLEKVLDGGDLEKRLVGLPLHVVELLLSSDKLTVESEDTVLCTAQLYADATARGVSDAAAAAQHKQMVYGKLAPLVRCPHLSHLWLLWSVVSGDAETQLLCGLQGPVRRLLMAQQAAPSGEVLTELQVKEYVPDAPASWLLPPRAVEQIDMMQHEWSVDVAAIKQAAQATAASHERTTWRSDKLSPPFAGIRWFFETQCRWDTTDADKHGVTFGAFTGGANLPPGAVCRASYSLECVGFTVPLASSSRGQEAAGAALICSELAQWLGVLMSWPGL